MNSEANRIDINFSSCALLVLVKVLLYDDSENPRKFVLINCSILQYSCMTWIT